MVEFFLHSRFGNKIQCKSIPMISVGAVAITTTLNQVTNRFWQAITGKPELFREQIIYENGHRPGRICLEMCHTHYSGWKTKWYALHRQRIVLDDIRRRIIPGPPKARLRGWIMSLENSYTHH